MMNRGKIAGIIPLFIGIVFLLLTFLWPKPFNPNAVSMLLGGLLFGGGIMILIVAWDE